MFCLRDIGHEYTEEVGESEEKHCPDDGEGGGCAERI